MKLTFGKSKSISYIIVDVLADHVEAVHCLLYTCNWDLADEYINWPRRACVSEFLRNEK